MHTTKQLIELAKQRLAEQHGLPLPMSDYRFEKLSGFSQSNVSRWVNGKNTIGTEFANRFAELTGLSPAYVLACTQHERTADPSVRQIWTTIAAAFKETKAAGWLAVAFLAAGTLFAPSGNQALAASLEPSGISIMRRRRVGRHRTWWRFFTVFPVAVLATGCASLTPLAEYQHLSHATQHFGDQRTNYGYDLASVGVRWRPTDHVTVDLLEGYSLQRMHGRREVFTGRVTVEFGGAR